MTAEPTPADQAGALSSTPTRPSTSGGVIAFTEEALFALMQQHTDRVDRFIGRMLGGQDPTPTADQAWAELTERWQRTGALRDPDNLLYKLARLRGTDRLRQLGRRPEDLSDNTDALNRAAEAIRQTGEFTTALVARLDLRTALADLPVRQRQALVLAYGHDLPHSYVAELLGVTPSRLANLLRTGKVHLANSPKLVGYLIPARPPEVHQ